MDEYREFIFFISVSSDPSLPENFKIAGLLVYVIENGGEHRLGTIDNTISTKLKKPNFYSSLL